MDEILVFDAGWIRPDPPPLEAEPVAALVASVRAAAPDVAAVFTSYHQSALADMPDPGLLAITTGEVIRALDRLPDASGGAA